MYRQCPCGGHVVLPVGVNPNTQIMGSNCEGSERGKLLCQFGGSGMRTERVWEREERERGEEGWCRAMRPLSTPSLRSFPTFSSLTVDSRRWREKEDEERIIIVLSGRNHGVHSRIYIGYTNTRISATRAIHFVHMYVCVREREENRIFLRLHYHRDICILEKSLLSRYTIHPCINIQPIVFKWDFVSRSNLRFEDFYWRKYSYGE